jgi:hypothetical protein
MRSNVCACGRICERHPHANGLLLETLDHREDDDLDASLDEIHEGSRLERKRGSESARSSTPSSEGLSGCKISKMASNCSPIDDSKHICWHVDVTREKEVFSISGG